MCGEAAALCPGIAHVHVPSPSQDGGSAGCASGLCQWWAFKSLFCPCLLPAFPRGFIIIFLRPSLSFPCSPFSQFPFQRRVSPQYSLCLICSFILNWQNSVYLLCTPDVLKYFFPLPGRKSWGCWLETFFFFSDTGFYCDKMFTNSALAKHHKFQRVFFSSLSPLFLLSPLPSSL